MNKYNYFKDKPKMLLLLSNYLHFLTFTAEMGKDRLSRSHETARICSSRFPTWEAVERFREQAKKTQTGFITFPKNQHAVRQILFLCSFVPHNGNLFHLTISME